MSGPMTIEEFVKWSLALPDPKRWELHDGRPTQRPASWWADGAAKGELLVQLHAALENDPTHEVLGFGLLVITGEATAVEPHLVIVPKAGVDWDDVVLCDPVAVVEVQRADGRAEYWMPRLRAYAMLPTVRHVVAVHAAARVALHLRGTAAGTITGRICGAAWWSSILCLSLSTSTASGRGSTAAAAGATEPDNRVPPPRRGAQRP